ncbi:MAG TPA: serine hydrolase [Pyrinomonadaceae bacterium]|nr:serine hydrolase [Pyrinomonadaceae bacterium]
MSQFMRLLFCIALLSVVCFGQKSEKHVEISVPAAYQAPVLQDSPELRSLLSDAINEVLKSYPADGFKPEEIAATLIDVRDPKQLKWANVRGDEPIYPASVVKMFYMAALHRQLQDGKVTSTPELMRGLKDMIVDSSNEATQYILDVLTDTSSGAELPLDAFEKWQYKRNRVNRYFSAMGFTKINVNQKTFCEDAYGIEQQSRNYKGQNRNMLTTNATARLLAEIALGRAVNADHSRQMMDLMKRDPFKESKDPDSQSTGFTGKAFIANKLTGANLWSKAGWTSKSRHDAAYVETADGSKFVLVIFTENHAADSAPIPTIAGKVIERMRPR